MVSGAITGSFGVAVAGKHIIERMVINMGANHIAENVETATEQLLLSNYPSNSDNGLQVVGESLVDNMVSVGASPSFDALGDIIEITGLTGNQIVDSIILDSVEEVFTTGVSYLPEIHFDQWWNQPNLIVPNPIHISSGNKPLM